MKSVRSTIQQTAGDAVIGVADSLLGELAALDLGLPGVGRLLAGLERPLDRLCAARAPLPARGSR